MREAPQKEDPARLCRVGFGRRPKAALIVATALTPESYKCRYYTTLTIYGNHGRHTDVHARSGYWHRVGGVGAAG